jgi:hypothetical protein
MRDGGDGRQRRVDRRVTGYSGLSVTARQASLIGFTRSLAREVGRLAST